MTNTIPNVPRELLEVIEQTWRIHYRGGPVTTDIAADAIEKGLGQLRALLSAPSPAGVDGLEVAGYFFQHEETGNVMSVDAQQVDWGFEANNPRLHRVCALTDYDKAQAIIDGLRGENERIRLNIAEYNEAISCYQSERDQQAQRIGELEGLLREVAATLAWIAHGECRAIHDGPIMPSQMALDAAKAALSAGKEGE